MPRWLPIAMLLVAVTCSPGVPGDTERPTTEEAKATRCPSIPTSSSGGPLWVMTDDLIPDVSGVCFTPTDPHLVQLLYENAAWGGSSAAAGVAHRGEKVLATFSVARVPEDTPGLDEGLPIGDVPTTRVGDVVVGWVRAAGRVAATWVNERDLVTVTGDDPAGLAEAAGAWLSGTGTDGDVVAPDDLRSSTNLPQSLLAGPPTDDLPTGYSAMKIDPLMFQGSDFADGVTIHEEENIEALGAAIILRDGGAVVGTVVGAIAETGQLSRWPSRLKGMDETVAAAGFTKNDVDVLVVGHDDEQVSRFVRAWRASIPD